MDNDDWRSIAERQADQIDRLSSLCKELIDQLAQQTSVEDEMHKLDVIMRGI